MQLQYGRSIVRCVVVALALVAAVFAPAVAAGSMTLDAEHEVRCTEIAFSQSVENRDRAGFVAFLHPDARFITGRVARGPEEIAESWSGYFVPDGATIRWRPETVEVNAEGTLALSRGPYRMTQSGEDGSRSERWGSFISIWRRADDGVWHIQFDTGADHGMRPTERMREILAAEPSCGDVALPRAVAER